MPYRNMRALELPESFRLPRCPRCAHEWYDDQASRELEALLPVLYEKVLKRRVRAAIDELCRYTSQRQLEQLLGLSQGYLSRLRAGAGVPSPELVSNLAQLAMDPGRRLEELRRYWSDPEASSAALDAFEVSR